MKTNLRFSVHAFLIFAAVSTLSCVAAAQSCATESLKPLVGSYSGIASMVTFDKGSFALRRPKALAPKAIPNQSVFNLDESDACNQFHVKIDYINSVHEKIEGVSSKLADLVAGKKIVREVQFDGRATEQEGIFTLSTDGVLKGHLRVIDGNTFMATFEAPNPLDTRQATSCKEFISLTKDGAHIVRTIQCFDSRTGEFVQDRLTMENIHR